VAIEFTEKQPYRMLLSVLDIKEENLLGMEATDRLGQTAHHSMHGMIKRMLEGFREGRIHPLMSEVGIVKESLIESFCV
jgi:hypothetical protein